MSKSRFIICGIVAIFFAIAIYLNLDEIVFNTKFIINQIIGFIFVSGVIIYAQEVITSKRLNNQTKQ